MKFQKIDESLLPQHSCLVPKDHCFFFGDYSGREGFNYSDTNSLIWNFKKDLRKKDKSKEWYWKEKSITDIANLILSTKLWDKLKKCLWVPFPSSKLKTDPDHDDRLMRVLQLLKQRETSLDVRELLFSKCSREAAHVSGKRLNVKEHLENMVFDHTQTSPIPKNIVVFDDVITSGASYKAAQIILEKEYPDAVIVGIFIGRSVYKLK